MNVRRANHHFYLIVLGVPIRRTSISSVHFVIAALHDNARVAGLAGLKRCGLNLAAPQLHLIRLDAQLDVLIVGNALNERSQFFRFHFSS